MRLEEIGASNRNVGMISFKEQGVYNKHGQENIYHSVIPGNTSKSLKYTYFKIK